MLDKLKDDYERQLRERWTPDGKRRKNDWSGLKAYAEAIRPYTGEARDNWLRNIQEQREFVAGLSRKPRVSSLLGTSKVLFAILFTLILSASTFASQINVTGRVSPMAKVFTYPPMYVRLYNVDTGAMRAVRTNLWGEYRFEAVNPTYTYTVSPYYRKALAFDPVSYTVRPYDNVSELNFWWSE